MPVKLRNRQHDLEWHTYVPRADPAALSIQKAQHMYGFYTPLHCLLPLELSMYIHISHRFYEKTIYSDAEVMSNITPKGRNNDTTIIWCPIWCSIASVV
jgi:hypothetical protein